MSNKNQKPHRSTKKVGEGIIVWSGSKTKTLTHQVEGRQRFEPYQEDQELNPSWALQAYHPLRLPRTVSKKFSTIIQLRLFWHRHFLVGSIRNLQKRISYKAQEFVSHFEQVIFSDQRQLSLYILSIELWYGLLAWGPWHMSWHLTEIYTNSLPNIFECKLYNFHIIVIYFLSWFFNVYKT